MPATVSETSIANLALAEICARKIVSLDADDEHARWSKRFYAQCRDEMLEEHPWDFAQKRATLSALVDAPLTEWSYAYPLPADFLAMQQLNSWEAYEAADRYEIEAGNLLTDEEEAAIRYTFQQADTTKYTLQFVRALALLLASRICKPITGEENTNLVAKYELALRKARRIDARSSKPHVKAMWTGSQLVASRYNCTPG